MLYALVVTLLALCVLVAAAAFFTILRVSFGKAFWASYSAFALHVGLFLVGVFGAVMSYQLLSSLS